MGSNAVDKALKKLESGSVATKSISFKLKITTIEAIDTISSKAGVNKDELVDELLATTGLHARAKQLGAKA